MGLGVEELFFSITHAEVLHHTISTLDFILCTLCKSAKSKQILVPQIANPHIATLAEVRKYNKFFKSANFRICDFRTLFADHTPFYFIKVPSGQFKSRLISS
jgi:hypothetical protein